MLMAGTGPAGGSPHVVDLGFLMVQQLRSGGEHPTREGPGEVPVYFMA